MSGFLQNKQDFTALQKTSYYTEAALSCTILCFTQPQLSYID